MYRAVVATIALSTALCANSAIVNAQSVSDEGRRHFEQGLRYLEGSRFRDAAVEFEASLRIERRASVYYNLGLAQRGVGANRAAIAAFRSYLSMDHDPGHVTLANRYIDELTASLGHLEFAVAPAAAHVRVDEENLAAGTTRVDVDPGPHRIHVEAPGFVADNRTVEVGQHAAVEVRVTLAAEPSAPTPSSAAPAAVPMTPPLRIGHLHVATNVDTATIRIDGRDVGTGTADVELEPGSHAIEATAPHRVTYRATVTLRADETLRVTGNLAGEGLGTGAIVGIAAGAGALVVAGVVLGVVLGTRVREPYQGTWGTVMPR